MINQRVSSFILGLTSALTLLCVVSCSTGSTHVADRQPKRTTSSTDESFAAEPLPSPTRGCDGSSELSPKERSAIVGAAVQAARAELDKNPKSIRDQNVRDRIATFAAIWIDDQTPLISLDRQCWADFAEAKKYLGEGNEDAAQSAGDAWRICLEAMFPDRVAIARPYFNCFKSDASKPADD